MGRGSLKFSLKFESSRFNHVKIYDCSENLKSYSNYLCYLKSVPKDMPAHILILTRVSELKKTKTSLELDLILFSIEIRTFTSIENMIRSVYVQSQSQIHFSSREAGS